MLKPTADAKTAHERERDSFLRDEIECSKTPPRSLRHIRQQRLRASSVLRADAAKVVEAEPPTTPERVISRLYPLIVSYAETLLDELVKFQQRTHGPNATLRKLPNWKEDGLEGIVADACASVNSQFLMTVNQLIGLYGENHLPETWRALWGTRNIWYPVPVDPRCKAFAKRVRARLDMHIDSVEAQLEAQALTPAAAPPKPAPETQPAADDIATGHLSEHDQRVLELVGELRFKTLTNVQIRKAFGRMLRPLFKNASNDAIKSSLDRIRTARKYPHSREISEMQSRSGAVDGQ